ncbi:MAG: hypothetical protein LBM93_08035, partial [Oscillospiraceae bacterium]|nr:hypothetical protein [Oscillospiraceae bacterium]
MSAENKSKQICKLSERLENLGKDNATAKLLYSTWVTDLTNISKKINVVSAPFLVFSDHGTSHSEGIISAIELLLGEERINALGYTDIWLILECAYRHDMGMHVSSKEIQELIEKEEFEKFLTDIKTSTDEDTRKAINNLLTQKHQNIYCEDIKDRLKNIESLSHDFNHILSSYYRTRHSTRSKEKIEEENHEDLVCIPTRIWDIVAKICEGHYTDIKTCLERLEQHEKGIDNDIAHPKFVQMLLRIGDILDIDNNRFNNYQLELINEDKISVATKGEILKHKSVKNLYISPKKISLYFSITLDESKDIAERDKIVRAACASISEMRKYLTEDLKELAEKWSEIAPDNFCGSVPVNCDFKLWLDGIETDPDELSLKYTFNHKRASDIIQGTSLYRTKSDMVDLYNNYRPMNTNQIGKQLEINWVFLREFIQNASDATKIQFFDNICRYEKDINNDCKNLLTPDIIINENGNLSGKSHEWKKYEDIYKFCINKLKVEISVECRYPENYGNISKDSNDNDGYEFIIKIKDRGIGIDKKTLKSMRNIGKESSALENRKIPSWLEPTASFGIGMQSAFELNKEFTATSYAKSENKVRHIIFSSAENGGEVFSYETDNNHHNWYGTEFTFKIPASKIAKQYGVCFISKERVFCDIKNYITKNIKEDLFPVKVTFKDNIISSEIDKKQ